MGRETEPCSEKWSSTGGLEPPLEHEWLWERARRLCSESVLCPSSSCVLRRPGAAPLPACSCWRAGAGELLRL